MYNDMVAYFKSQHAESKVATGQFGAMMQVDLVNDGPVTIELDSNSKFPGAVIACLNACLNTCLYFEGIISLV